MCIPSGTRQADTQTRQVAVRWAWPVMGVGSGWVEVRVAQSMPRAPMMWVPKVTVPEVTGRSPVLRRVREMFSHQRTSAPVRLTGPVVRWGGVLGLGVGVGVGVGVGRGLGDGPGPVSYTHL